MKKQYPKSRKKSPSSSIFLSDEDDDIDQFRQLEEAVQQDSSSDSDLFLNPDRLKKKFPNLFGENKKISQSSSSSADENLIKKSSKSAPPDNTDQIQQLTNDLHQAFELVTQKKAELEREQQKFIKEKKNFAKEKARYESEQIFADTEASSASYMLLNQKYKSLKDKYKFKKSEWEKERQQYISQIAELNKKIDELTSKNQFNPNQTNSIAHIDTSSDSEISDQTKVFNKFNQNKQIDKNEDEKDNPFSIAHLNPSPQPKYSQSKIDHLLQTQIQPNPTNPKNDFQRLAFNDNENNVSEDDEFNIIEDDQINNKAIKYSNNIIEENHFQKDSPQIKNLLNQKTSPQIQNLANQKVSPQIQNTRQITPQISNSRQISPQIPESLKLNSDNSNDSANAAEKNKKFIAFKNWDDYDDSSDFLQDDSQPQIDKPLVFRAVIPKDSQKSSSNSEINSSPPSKRGKKSNESIQKKVSPIRRNKNEEIISTNPPIQKSFPPLFNMNNKNQPKVQKAPLIKSNLSNDPKPVRKDSLFENYDVNFDVDFGDIIEEKEGPNHKKIIKYFDGSTEIVFPNKTRKVTRSDCVYVFYQNGDISQDFNDGARAYKYLNGTIDLTLPDGVILCLFPNGQREKHFLNGDKEIIYQTGERKFLKANVKS